MEELEATQEESERVRRELALQREAVDRSVAVVEFDPQGYILEANENFAQLMGYVPDELKGRHHSLFVSEDYAQSEAYQQLWQRLRAGEYITDEFERYGRDGQPRYIRASYSPVLNAQNEPYKVMMMAYDITDLKLAQQQ
jgi:methyl-accepting chemotaxis protein